MPKVLPQDHLTSQNNLHNALAKVSAEYILTSSIIMVKVHITSGMLGICGASEANPLLGDSMGFCRNITEALTMWNGQSNGKERTQ